MNDSEKFLLTIFLLAAAVFGYGGVIIFFVMVLHSWWSFVPSMGYWTGMILAAILIGWAWTAAFIGGMIKEILR